MTYFDIPSRSKCRLLWTMGDYAAIAQNYESNVFYRKLFVRGIRKLDLESIYLTSLLHLGRKEEIFRHTKIIEELKDSGLLAYRLELNHFVINNMKIKVNNDMAKALDAFASLPRCQDISIFWRKNIDKQIAIIGNAPIIEKSGKIIDSSDCVLRFNQFTTAGYEQFIGSKTDVWCRICDIRPNKNPSCTHNTIPINILTDNPLTTPVGPFFLNDILDTSKTFYIIPQNLVKKISLATKAIPSSGIRVLTSLSEHLHNIKFKPLIYGFSFKSNKYNKRIFDHYFEKKSETKEKAHNIKMEIELLKNMYKKE